MHNIAVSYIVFLAITLSFSMVIFRECYAAEYYKGALAVLVFDAVLLVWTYSALYVRSSI